MGHPSKLGHIKPILGCQLYRVHFNPENETNKTIFAICSDFFNSTLESIFIFSYISPKCAMNKEILFLENLKLEQIFIFDKIAPSLTRIRLICYVLILKHELLPIKIDHMVVKRLHIYNL